MNAIATKLLDHAYLSTDVGYSAIQQTREVPVSGNSVVMSAFVHNTGGAGTLTLTFQLEASYDGRTWLAIGSALTKSSFGYGPGTAESTVRYAWLRVTVTASSSGGNNDASCDVTITQTQQ